MTRPDNFVLIGMPGIGKSTLGIVLAKILGMDFVDTDLLVQRAGGAALDDLLRRLGSQRFCDLEGEVLASLDVHDTIVSTGGSAVYSDAAMRHLASIGTIVYLWGSLDEVSRRLGGLDSRGVVRRDGDAMTVADLYAERTPLYERYADVTYAVKSGFVRDDAERLAKILRTEGDDDRLTRTTRRRG
ncbi:MAG: shikimate kinase [Coriobacteriales bacterium]